MNLRNVIILVFALLLGIVATVTQGAERPCVHCGRYHGKAQVQAPSIAVASPYGDGLALLNRQRAARGIGPFVEDPVLMAKALEKAKRAASRGKKGHLGGSLSPANREGVGWTSGSRKFMACYAYTGRAGSQAGGACVQGRDGWYSCLMISDGGGYIPSGASPIRSIVPRGGGGFRPRLFRR